MDYEFDTSLLSVPEQGSIAMPEIADDMREGLLVVADAQRSGSGRPPRSAQMAS